MNNYLKYLTDFGDFLDEIKFGFVFDIRLVYVGFFFSVRLGLEFKFLVSLVV